MLGSKKEYALIGYDCEERVYELLRANVGDHEEIRFLSFLEDHIPSYLFLVTYNRKEKQSIFRILKLKKNKQTYETFKIEESRNTITENILQNINKGNFRRTRKKSIDNLELLPKTKEVYPEITGNTSKDTNYLIKKSAKTAKHLNSKNYSSMFQNIFTSNNGGIASMNSLNSINNNQLKTPFNGNSIAQDPYLNSFRGINTL